VLARLDAAEVPCAGPQYRRRYGRRQIKAHLPMSGWGPQGRPHPAHSGRTAREPREERLSVLCAGRRG
jgi:hypothetical protein